MRNFVYILMFFIAGCSTGNKIPVTQDDKALMSAIKKLDKDPSNNDVRTSLSNLYNNAAKSHLDKIQVYNTSTDPGRWSKIIKEYEALQKLSQVISVSANASKLLNVSPYDKEILAAKQDAAEEWYQLGISELSKQDKMSARNAYSAFKQVNGFMPGYKDVLHQMDLAYKNAVLNVVIYPVRDNSFFYSDFGWNSYGNNFYNDYFQRNLVRDLNSYYSKNSPAIFFTDWEMRSQNIRPDWEVDLTWTDLRIPPPTRNYYSRTVSKQIETYRDSTGKSYYRTATATINITRESFTAYGDMDVRISDATEKKIIADNHYNAQYNWQQEYATYTGSSEALSENDYRMINRNFNRAPRSDEIVNYLFNQIYPQVKNRIASVVNW